MAGKHVSIASRLRGSLARIGARLDARLGLSFNTILKDVLEQIRGGEVQLDGATWVPNAYIIYLCPGVFRELERHETVESVLREYPEEYERIVYNEIIFEEGHRIAPLDPESPIYFKIWPRSGHGRVTVEGVHLDPRLFAKWPEKARRDQTMMIQRAYQELTSGHPQLAAKILELLLPIAPLNADLHVTYALACHMSGNAGEALRAMIYVHRRALWQHAAQGFCRLVAAEELDPVCGHDFSNEINALFDDLGQLVPSSEEFHRSLGYYRTVLATHTGWKEPHDLEDCGPAAQFWAQLDEYADMVPAPWLVPRIALPLLASQIDTWTPQELERIFHVLDWSTWVKPVCADDMLRATVNSRQATLARLQQLNSRNGFAWYWLGRLKAANGSEQESRAARAAFKRAHQLARTNTYYYSTALDARGANYRAGTVVDGE